MVSHKARPLCLPRNLGRSVGVFAALLVSAALLNGQGAKVDVLRIGTTGGLTGTAAQKEEEAMETLKGFIKDETGLKNEILRQKDWREVADKMAKGDLHLGVFQGFEFAWAKEKHPDLKPLALAINVYRYPIAHVVTKSDAKATNFAGLQGNSLSIPATGQRYLRLFVERQAQANGKPLETFFSKITFPEDVEEALDDVVDGTVQATVAERAALDAYKRRKPGRFNKLKEVARSQPLPPALVAHYGKVLDESTLNRFREGLLGASRKERGQTTLNLFRLTGFEVPPTDFEKVLTETRKTYPPPDPKTK